MGLLDAGYALFEFTGQKLLDIYDIISSAPAIVKIFQNNPTKKNRRREKGLAGKFLTPKRGITKNKHKHIKSKDAHIIVTPRSQKLSLAITPSLQSRPASTAPSTPSTPFTPATPFTAPTPAPSTSSAPAPTPAPEKIQKLESELTKLREEIAKLMNQPKASTTTHQGASGTVSFASQQVVPQSFVPSPSSPAPAPAPSMSASIPIPPPPPPPMMGDATPKLYRSASSVEPNTTNNTSTPKKDIPRTMSLADVLKGASTANLRKTEMSRSPGGTPLETPTKATNGGSRMNDPQDFIAQALRKKFASINKYNTPETTSKRKTVDGDSGWDESPPASPERTRKYTPIAYVQDENVPPTISLSEPREVK